MVRLQPRTKTVLAWSLWLASMGCCAGGLLPRCYFGPLTRNYDHGRGTALASGRHASVGWC